MLKTISVSALICLWVMAISESASAADLNGIWTKTTSPDPDHITLIYREMNDIKAIGYGEIGGKKAVWHATGEFKGFPLRLHYRYSAEAVPSGWEQVGVMILDLSADGKILSGKATSASGNWSGPVRFKRIR